MLIGRAISLGPVLAGDGPQLFNWRNDVGLGHDNGFYRPHDQIQFEAWLNGAGADPSRVLFTIRDNADMRLMGYLQLTNILPGPRTAELGVMIGDAADRGRGHGQEAVALAARFCWRELNLQRLTLFVIGDNPRAVRAYEKTGFEREGLMRRAAYVDGDYRDITVMGLLRPPMEASAA